MDGCGTEEDPYKIIKLEHLRAVNQDLSSHYELVSNIDATKTKQKEFIPIGNFDDPFTGTFDGIDHRIANLCIEGTGRENVGLFGCVGEEGQVRNLVLANATIEGIQSVGSLVGCNCGKIESSCASGGDASARSFVGGLVGENHGEVESSYVHGGDVSGNVFVGGLVGCNRSKIASSYVQEGDVSGGRVTGGLVGENSSEIESSYVQEGDVLGDKDDTGGLVGYNRWGKIEFSYVQGGSVSGHREVGGLVGENSGEVESSYVHGVGVSGENSIGGLVGENFGGEVELSYAVKVDVLRGRNGVGGLVGENFDGEVELSYAVKVDVSGEQKVGGLIGYNSGEDLMCLYSVSQYISGDEYVGNLVGRDDDNDKLEGLFVLSDSDESKPLEDVDLVILRKNHRVLYVLDTNTLHIQVDGEVYSHQGVLPNQMQPLVDETEVAKISDKFMASVVSTI